MVQRHNAKLQPSLLYMDGSCTRYLGLPQGPSAHAYGGGGGTGHTILFCPVQAAENYKSNETNTYTWPTAFKKNCQALIQVSNLGYVLFVFVVLFCFLL